MAYRHLRLEERELLYGMLQKGESQRSIARKLGRSQSSISRELRRNTRYGKEYLPCHAQKRYERIGINQRYKAPLKSPEILLFVREHLRQPYVWSPEAIAGRLAYESKGKLTITAECIYQYIYSKQVRKDKLWQNLACGRKKRMNKNGRKVHNKGRVPNAVSISKRPKYIQKRKQVGHWETDDMEGSRSSKSALSVTRERAYRYTKLSKMRNQTMVEKTRAVVADLSNFPKQIRRTMTQDNGKENYGHEQIGQVLETKMYFCHAYTSCEKGGVERAIKDIRRFIPKGTPLSKVSKEKVAFVEWWLNNKPMKCLQWMKPHEKMQQLLATLDST